jgi:D-sedoheptulose 7-phosphate isomerase
MAKSMDSTDPVVSALLELSDLAAESARSIHTEIAQAGAMVAGCVASGGQVLACGNGGSAADAQHFVAELVGRMSVERGPLPAISLSSDPSVVSALGNDYGFEFVFSRQVEGFGRAGDVFLGITTSGASPNVLAALKSAHSRNMKTLLLTSTRSSENSLCDVLIKVPSRSTQRIQEMHMLILHTICEQVDNAILKIREIKNT